jgi:hypothetical protein
VSCAIGEDPLIQVTLVLPADDDVVLGPDCPDEEGVWWNSIVLPSWTYRVTNAPSSAWTPGTVLLAVVRDVSSLALTVAARGTDTTSLEAQKAILDAAFGSYPYSVQITVDDGDPATPVTILDAAAQQPTLPAWGQITPQLSGMFAAEATVILPLNPPGSP